jgi:hypothetical protein
MAKKLLMRRVHGKVLSFGPFECRIKQNVEELASLNLRQRVLSGALAPSLEDR